MCRYVSARQAVGTPLSVEVADLDGDGVLKFVVSLHSMPVDNSR